MKDKREFLILSYAFAVIEKFSMPRAAALTHLFGITLLNFTLVERVKQPYNKYFFLLFIIHFHNIKREIWAGILFASRCCMCSILFRIHNDRLSGKFSNIYTNIFSRTASIFIYLFVFIFLKILFYFIEIIFFRYLFILYTQ